MPYKSTSELGKGKEDLPEAAKKIFMAAYNSNSELGEERAHAIAWSAVKKKYQKNEKGTWVAKTGDAATVDVVNHIETMQLDVNDAANLQITKDGFLVAVPRIARTGIQLYGGDEMGIDDKDTVIRVYRPEGEVFDLDALKSLAYRPVTLDHPPEMVDAKNWKKWAVGQLGGDFARDGQFIRFPMTIMDAEAVNAIKKGKAQLSVGYVSDIRWEDGNTPDGEPYDAIQGNIRANHVAVVGMARGGSKLKIGDDDFIAPIEDEATLRNAITAIGRAKDQTATIAFVTARAKSLGLDALIPKDWSGTKSTVSPNKRSSAMPDRETNLRTIVVDGVSIEVPEISAQVVQRAIDDREKEVVALRKQVEQREAAASTTLTDQRKLIDERDGTIAALKRQIADNEMTPGKLDKLVRDRLDIVDKAKKIMGDTYDCSGRTDIEIKRAVVAARLGEQESRAMSDEAVNGSFHTLMAAKGGNSVDLGRPLGDANNNGGVHSSADAARIAYDARNKRLNNAWRREDTKAAS